jgi:uncharacterized protein
MPGRRLSATGWVQLAQALIARELVVSFGFPERQAGERLGIAPSAVSQYLSGKRLGASTEASRAPERERAIARVAAQRIAAPTGGPAVSVEVVFEAARELALAARSPAATGAGAPAGPETPDPTRDREVRRYLRRRIALEQAAVGECMRLAQRSRDELTRAVFRQIASDSLRHAEIVASIQTYLERGLRRAFASGVRRGDIERLIQREREAEAGLDDSFGPEFGGMIHVLWESMEADERKHEVLLEAMLQHGLPPAEAAPARPAPRHRRRP